MYMMKRRWDAASGAAGQDFGDVEGENEIEGDDEEDWLQPSELDLSLNPPKRSCQMWQEIQPASAADGNQPFLYSKLGHTRTIVHIDLDCFYAQVEMLRNPSLRDKPLGIQQKNIVVTTNYVARARGVSKLSYIKEALIKCPDLVLVSGEDLTNYRETSAKVTEVLEGFCPLVERLGFDENYLDVTQLVEKHLSSGSPTKKPSRVGHSYGEDDQNVDRTNRCRCGCRERLTVGTHIAAELRNALHSKLGLTSCAGVATNKLLAKLVGGHHKPNDQTVLYSESVECFMGTFSKVREIPGIGHSSGKKLAEIGITSMQQLQEAQISSLTDQFDVQQAEKMIRLANGIDDTPVVSKGQPQSLSDEDSFKKCSSLSSAKDTMTGLLRNLLKRLRSDGRIPNTMRVTVRKYSPRSWHRESRQTTIPGSIFRKQDDDFLLSQLLNLAVSLFQKLVDTGKPFHLTLINICFTNLRSKVSKGSLDAFLGTRRKVESDPSNVSEGSRGVCVDRQVQGGLLKSNNPSSSRTSSGKEGTGVNAQGDNSEARVLQDSRVDHDESMMAKGASFWKPTTSPAGVGSETTGYSKAQKVAASGQRTVRERFPLPAHSPKRSSSSSFFSQKSITNKGLQAERSDVTSSEYNSNDQSAHSASGGAMISTMDSGITQTQLSSALNQSRQHHNEMDTVINERVYSQMSNEQCVTDDTLYCGDASVTMPLNSSSSVNNDIHVVQANSSDKCSNEQSSYAHSSASTTRTNDFQSSKEPKADEMESEIPPDIDRIVFNALPVNMREELLEDWRITRQRRIERDQGGNEMERRNEKRPTSNSKSVPGKLKSSSKHKLPRTHKERQNTLFRYLKK